MIYAKISNAKKNIKRDQLRAKLNKQTLLQEPMCHLNINSSGYISAQPKIIFGGIVEYNNKCVRKRSMISDKASCHQLQIYNYARKHTFYWSDETYDTWTREEVSGTGTSIRNGNSENRGHGDSVQEMDTGYRDTEILYTK